MPVIIRPATVDDAPFLSKICLLTANAGTSAEHLFSKPELPGLVHAVPYVHLSGCWAYVLADIDSGGTECDVVGYFVGAEQTADFEQEMADTWLPPLAKKYPVGGEGTTMDKEYYGRFANPERTTELVLNVVPSHLHINILPKYQRRGWGTKLISTGVDYLRGKGYKGVYAQIDPRNDESRRFWMSLGFKDLESGGNGEFWGLEFATWKF